MKGIYPRLKAKYGNSIDRFFTPSGKDAGMKLIWDPIINQVSSDGDRDMDALKKADQDMIMPTKPITPIHAKEETSAQVVVYEKDRGSSNSITTIEGRTRNPPHRIQHSTFTKNHHESQHK